MLYAILCYNDESAVWSWSKAEEDACMARLAAVQEKLVEQGKLGPVARLMPTTAATTLRKDREPPLVIDGPFAETKEQLAGYYILDCRDLDEAIEWAARIPTACKGGRGCIEIRPMPGLPPHVESETPLKQAEPAEHAGARNG
jgi:hypothetical protein